MRLCDKIRFYHCPHSRQNNTAADCLSRVEMGPNKKLIQKLPEDVDTRPIEVIVQSAGVSEEEQVYFTEEGDETKEQVWERKNLPTKPHKVGETVEHIDAILEQTRDTIL